MNDQMTLNLYMICYRMKNVILLFCLKIIIFLGMFCSGPLSLEKSFNNPFSKKSGLTKLTFKYMHNPPLEISACIIVDLWIAS